MFGWLKRKPKVEIYPEKERLIFKYFNGEKTIWADPLVLYKRFMEVGPELSVDVKVSRSQSKDARKAHDAMIKKICGIFNLKQDPFDLEKCLNEKEISLLLEQFFIYIEAQKKNSSHSVTSLTLSEDSKTTSEESPPTTNTLDSGLTKNESSTNEPQLLPTERP